MRIVIDVVDIEIIRRLVERFPHIELVYLGARVDDCPRDIGEFGSGSKRGLVFLQEIAVGHRRVFKRNVRIQLVESLGGGLVINIIPTPDCQCARVIGRNLAKRGALLVVIATPLSLIICLSFQCRIQCILSFFYTLQRFGIGIDKSHRRNTDIIKLYLIPFSIKISSGFAANAREALVVRGSPSEY